MIYYLHIWQTKKVGKKKKTWLIYVEMQCHWGNYCLIISDQFECLNKDIQNKEFNAGKVYHNESGVIYNVLLF